MGTPIYDAMDDTDWCYVCDDMTVWTPSSMRLGTDGGSVCTRCGRTWGYDSE